MKYLVSIYVGTERTEKQEELNEWVVNDALAVFERDLQKKAGGYTRLIGAGGSRECPYGEETTVYQVLCDDAVLAALKPSILKVKEELSQGSILVVKQRVRAEFI